MNRQIIKATLSFLITLIIALFLFQKFRYEQVTVEDQLFVRDSLTGSFYQADNGSLVELKIREDLPVLNSTAVIKAFGDIHFNGLARTRWVDGKIYYNVELRPDRSEDLGLLREALYNRRNRLFLILRSSGIELDRISLDLPSHTTIFNGSRAAEGFMISGSRPITAKLYDAVDRATFEWSL